MNEMLLGVGKSTPPRGSTQLSTTMPRAIAYADMTTDGTDNVYMAGSDNAFSTQNWFYRYTLSTNTWTPLANVPVARCKPALSYLNGKVYYFAGNTGGGTNGSTNATYVYDIANNTWTLLTTTGTPVARSESAMVGNASNGLIYMSAGMRSYNDGSAADDFYTFNPATNVWAVQPKPDNYPRNNHSLLNSNGKLYLFHPGVGAQGRIYDIATATWTGMPQVGLSLANQRGEILDGVIYVPYNSNSVQSWWSYNIASNTWQSIAETKMSPRFSPIPLNVAGRYLLFGGSFNATNIYEVWEFKPPL